MLHSLPWLLGCFLLLGRGGLGRQRIFLVSACVVNSLMRKCQLCKLSFTPKLLLHYVILLVLNVYTLTPPPPPAATSSCPDVVVFVRFGCLVVFVCLRHFYSFSFASLSANTTTLIDVFRFAKAKNLPKLNRTKKEEVF